MVTLIACSPKSIPREKWVAAARHAVEVNPTNDPRLERLDCVMAVWRLAAPGASRCIRHQGHQAGQRRQDRCRRRKRGTALQNQWENFA
jgi:hypothetical protein